MTPYKLTYILYAGILPYLILTEVLDRTTRKDDSSSAKLKPLSRNNVCNKNTRITKQKKLHEGNNTVHTESTRSHVSAGTART